MTATRIMRTGRIYTFTDPAPAAEAARALAMATRLFEGDPTPADIAYRDSIIEMLRWQLTGRRVCR